MNRLNEHFCLSDNISWCGDNMSKFEDAAFCPFLSVYTLNEALLAETPSSSNPITSGWTGLLQPRCNTRFSAIWCQLLSFQSFHFIFKHWCLGLNRYNLLQLSAVSLGWVYEILFFTTATTVSLKWICNYVAKVIANMKIWEELGGFQLMWFSDTIGKE